MRFSRVWTVLAVAALAAACSDDSSPTSIPAITGVAPAVGVPASYADVVAGSDIPVTVIVTTAQGAVANVTVTFQASAGGTVSPATAQTGADGKVSVTWKLAPTVGGNTLTVTASGKTTTFTASTKAGAAAKLVLNAGNNQSATVGTAVPVPPSVKVTDANDNLILTPVAVTFTVATGAGTINSGAANATVQTVAGVASLSNWILGTAAGTGNNTVTASSAGLAGSPVTISASARAGAATSLAIKGGNNQTAIAGTTVPVPPSVVLKDAMGNPVPDVEVTFSIITGGGTVAPSVVKTDASGTATVTGWVLGTIIGANSLRASANALPPVTFSATGITGAAAKIEKLAGDSAIAAAGTLVPTAPAVRVTDSNGNVVENADVTFAVSTGGGTITGAATVKSNASGIATLGGWKLGPAAGKQTLTASSGSLVGSPLTFTATATQTPASIAVFGGNNQTAIAGTAVATAPSVIVKDPLGNPIAGADVIFAVTSGGGTVAPTTVVKTNAQGIATATSWTLGTTVANNPNTLSASVSGQGVAAATIAATAVPGPAVRIAKYAGDSQTGGVGAPLPIDPSVRVLDANDNPVGAGTKVTFAVTSGGGAINGAATVQTNAAGIATLEVWVLGATPGTNTLVATSGNLAGSPVTFTANGIQAIATMSVNAGNNQVATAGTNVATPPSVIVRDGANNPLQNVAVTFSVIGGGGTVNPSTVIMTDALGIATVTSWTLGTTVGANTLRASAPGIVPVTFTATGTTGPAAILSKNLGDNQTATAGYSVAIAPSVRVTDINGNPVGAGTNVTFAIASGGGSITGPATVQTNASGVAAVGGWTLGTTAGSNTLTATSGALTGSPATFTATGTAPVPASIAVNGGNNQTATVGTAVATAPSVVVRDASSNPIVNASVTFAVTGGGGSITGSATVQTNASGIATVGGWTLGTTAGSNSNTLSATVSGLSAVTITASTTAGAAATILRNSADPDTGVVFGTAGPPSVKVVDQYNNPVQGTSVAFAITGGGGTIGGTNPATTDASGIATVGSWTLGSASGANTLTATSGALTNSPLTFTTYALMDYEDPLWEATRSAVAGDSVKPRVGVMIFDQNNSVVAGVSVTFQITSGGGTFGAGGPTSFTAVTNSLGKAGASATQFWFLGTTPGLNTMTATATVGGRTLVLTFRATGT